MSNNMNVGDLIAVDGATGNHGCTDYAIFRYDGGGRMICIEVQSCHSCWQVGHDSDHVFARLGETWGGVDPNELTPAGIVTGKP